MNNLQTYYELYKMSKIKKYYLGPSYPNVYLSRREAQCIAYFLKGYSSRRVGETLKISSKTVDFYTDRAKFKLDCTTKMELIIKICQTNFLSYVNELVKIK